LLVTTHFHKLRIADAHLDTPDAKVIAFAVREDLKPLYQFTQGQHLTLRAFLDGEDVRRSYSICSAPHEGVLQVAIKRVAGGRFSTFVHEHLQAGDTIDVMPPDGRFFTALDAANAKHYVAFVAGSGITPVLSLVKTTLAIEARSHFTLIYGNRNIDSIMFNEALEDIKDTYLQRFALYHFFSREYQEVDLLNGRLDGAKCKLLLELLLPPDRIDEAFICGPHSMIDEVGAALAAAGVTPAKIHTERFGTPEANERTGASATDEIAPDDLAPAANVTIIVDGARRQLRVPLQGASILDTALRAGADLPYACKGGMCCTCRAKLVAGKVRMDKNYSLEEREMAQGFILTCQSHPLTGELVVDYDAR
jgi:ring-1,2-phenylacetyl-CoA epoxidase subunit PaaE